MDDTQLHDHQRLRVVRKKMNLTQTEFAKLLKITQGWYSDVERGKKSMSYNLLTKLSLEFHVNSEWLVSGLGEPFKANRDTVIDEGSQLQEPVSEYSTRPNLSEEKSVVIEEEKSEIDSKATLVESTPPTDLGEDAHESSSENTQDMTHQAFELRSLQSIVESQSRQLQAQQEQIQTLTQLIQAYRMETMKRNEEWEEFQNYLSRKKTA